MRVRILLKLLKSPSQLPLITTLSTLAAFVASVAFAAFTTSATAATEVVMLGTGTPVPDPERAGPGVAIVVNEQAYVFDAGGGMVKRAAQAFHRYQQPALNPQNINHLFLTHLHSDHIHDVSELASARWWGRQQRLQIFGPQGISEYAGFMGDMAAIEADIRAAGTPPELITDRHAYRAEVTEIDEGWVFENADIRVEAFSVPHGDIRPAFGYRVTTADKTIVMSGDTTYSEKVRDMARGADILIHEVISGERLAQESEFWQEYHGASHTTTQQLARLASEAQPDLLVLYHVLFLGASAEDIVAEIKRDYEGEVVLAEDLDRF